MNLKDIQTKLKELNNDNWTARQWSAGDKQRVYFNFKGKGDGYLEISEGVIKDIFAGDNGLKKLFSPFVGEDYDFHATDRVKAERIQSEAVSRAEAMKEKVVASGASTQDAEIVDEIITTLKDMEDINFILANPYDLEKIIGRKVVEKRRA